MSQPQPDPSPESRVDRLSQLPPELLSIIFGLIGSNDDHSVADARLCLISKALLPFARERVYSRLVIPTVARSDAWVRTILGRPELGSLVRHLLVHTVYPPHHDTYRIPNQLESATGPYQFWTQLSNLESISLIACTGLLRTLLRVSAPPGAALFAKLKAAKLSDEFSDEHLPFGATHYRNLFRIAPNLETLHLITFPVDYDDESDEAAEPDQEKAGGGPLSQALRHLSLDTCTEPHHSACVVSLCNKFPNLRALVLSDYFNLDGIASRLNLPELRHLLLNNQAEHEGDPCSPNLSKLTSLETVKLGIRSRYNSAILATTPPSLTKLAIGSACAITPADLLALFAPGARRPPALARIEVDHVPAETWFPPEVFRGPKIDLARPVLMETRAGEPVLRPLLGWSLPEWTFQWEDEGDGDFEDLVRVRGLAKAAGVELSGDLFECVAVQEAYIGELAKCEVLRERYDKGELEWELWEGIEPVEDDDRVEDD